MSARIPPGFAEIWTRFSVPGDSEPMYCSLGVNLSVGVAANQTVADLLLGVTIANWDNISSSSYVVGSGHVIFGQDGGDLRIEGTVADAQGDIATIPCPQNVAVLVRKITAFGGRRGRGRMYYPGIPRDKVSEIGVIDGTHLSNINSAMNDIQTTMVGLAEVDALCLFHDTAPFTPTDVTDLVAVSPVATQRRRLRP